MKRAAADAEFFRRGSYVAVRGCERLGDKSSLGLVQIERTRLLSEGVARRNARWQRRCCSLPDGHRQIAQCNLFAGRHHHAMYDGGAQLANVAGPIVSQKRVHRFWGEFDKRLLVFLAEVARKAADENRNVFFSLA